MNFKKWVKSIQTAAYNGARTVDGIGLIIFHLNLKIKSEYRTRAIITRGF